ncbi:hypothetical protein F511_42178 [Dorcoceras hygrometricum]|uniref:Uncharacterized protein n=1 Tax=Dorcoceras hygrometricum TaxID=472368 RepID=A0A2Z7B7A5_9LAMI|nr:hypothetical protein F511_42178 [Dorcoceras hygrometricum]
MLTIVLDKDLECTIVYVRCDSGYEGYHETHLIITVYSELVPSRLGRQNEDKAAEIETSICDAKYHVSLDGRPPPPLAHAAVGPPKRRRRPPPLAVFYVIGLVSITAKRRNLPPPIVKCRFPREAGRSQALRRQQEKKLEVQFGWGATQLSGLGYIVSYSKPYSESFKFGRRGDVEACFEHPKTIIGSHSFIRFQFTIIHYLKFTVRF